MSRIRSHLSFANVVSVVALFIALAAATAATADAPVDPGTLLDGVNARRAADGMPSVTGDGQMHQGCLNHVNYGLLNGSASGFPDDPHDELAGKPGYTELGRKAAGRSVLSFGLLNGGRPFHHAPGHLFHFLSPFPLKAGVAERTEGAVTLSCAWFANADADDVEQRRAPSNPPKQWSVPFDAQTGVPTWESHFDAPPTNLYEAGFTSDPSGPALAGPVIQLYQEDVGMTRLDDLCQGVLIAPGGQTVTSAPLRRGQLVIKDPLLPSATYRQVSTFTSDPGCHGGLQRTGSSSFTTAAPRLVEDIIELTDPFMDPADGHWKMRAKVGEELGYFTKGNGTIRSTFTMGDPQYFGTFRDAFWQQGGMTLWLDQGPSGQVLTIEAQPDALSFGPTCYGPQRAVRRSYLRTMNGVTAQGPEEVVASGADPCTAAPDVTARSPAAGGAGTVVRLNGTAITRATRVRVGGVDAHRWRPDGSDLLVTVPNGAMDGAISVDTPYGNDSSETFDVTADLIAPLTVVQAGPSGSAGPTATFVFDVEAGSQAMCSVDLGPFTVCTSPMLLDGLADGVHSFAVRTIDPAGNVEATPVMRSWTVVPPPAPLAPTGGEPTDGQSAPTGGDTFAAPPSDVAQTPAPGASVPSSPSARPVSVLLRSGALRIVRGIQRKGRRITIGVLEANRAASARLTVRVRRRVVLRINRTLRAGQSVPVAFTLPVSLAKRRSVTLTVTLGTRSARVTVKR